MQNHRDSHSEFLALKPIKLVWSICMYTWTNAHYTLAPDISQEIGITAVQSEYCAFFEEINDFAFCRYCFVIDKSNHAHILLGLPASVTLFVEKFIDVDVHQPRNIMLDGEIDGAVGIGFLSVDKTTFRSHIWFYSRAIKQYDWFTMCKTFQFAFLARVVHENDDNIDSPQVVVEPNSESRIGV